MCDQKPRVAVHLRSLTELPVSFAVDPGTDDEGVVAELLDLASTEYAPC